MSIIPSGLGSDPSRPAPVSVACPGSRASPPSRPLGSGPPGSGQEREGNLRPGADRALSRGARGGAGAGERGEKEAAGPLRARRTPRSRSGVPGSPSGRQGAGGAGRARSRGCGQAGTWLGRSAAPRPSPAPRGCGPDPPPAAGASPRECAARDAPPEQPAAGRPARHRGLRRPGHPALWRPCGRWRAPPARCDCSVRPAPRAPRPPRPTRTGPTTRTSPAPDSAPRTPPAPRPRAPPAPHSHRPRSCVPSPRPPALPALAWAPRRCPHLPLSLPSPRPRRPLPARSERAEHSRGVTRGDLSAAEPGGGAGVSLALPAESEASSEVGWGKTPGLGSGATHPRNDPLPCPRQRPLLWVTRCQGGSQTQWLLRPAPLLRDPCGQGLS